MASRILSNALGTLKSSWRILRATFDASGLTVARTFTLPDLAGEVALQSQYVKLKVVAIAEGATSPDPGGQAWVWSSTTGTPMFWDSGRWRGIVAISVGTIAPANPAVGHLWVDTN